MLKRLCMLMAASLVLSGQAATADTEAAYEWPLVRSGRVVLESYAPLSSETNQEGILRTGYTDLDLILHDMGTSSIRLLAPGIQVDQYVIQFDPAVSVETAMDRLEQWRGTLGVWPAVLVPWQEMLFNANDLLLPSQWHHDAIKSQEAWSIFRGADTIQVAIVDGGVAYMHPDLADNIWINSAEDLNGNRIFEPSEEDGIDNDANGYIDDFWGWDWIDLDSSAVWPGEDPGPPDNDPADFDGHGTHCAGDACAATNNGIGVAAPGFNCQIMSLRAGYLSVTGQGYVDLLAASAAVYYATNMRAEVISMSFGGPGAVSYFRSALEYAESQGLVLVAAAGNESSSIISYPAGYDIVIAVAATAEGDVLADFTNFGSWITLCAPGDAIKSTIIEGYGNMGGTSMATPIVAGAAALVKALKPEWSSQEVGIWLSYTADNIDAQNPGYVGMMGGGRLNVQRAVDMFVSIDSVWADDGSGGTRLRYWQEGQLYVQFHNSYGSATNVNLELQSSNPRVSIAQSSYQIGTLPEGQSGTNSGAPFLVTVEPEGAFYELIDFEAHFTADEFDFTQVLQIPVGHPQVLIIDADQNNEERTAAYYEDYLTSNDYSWETWVRSNREALGDEMSEYQAIIHLSGTAETNIFPAGDWEDLEDYVVDGGNLLVTGQNVAEDLAASQPDVLEDVLRVEYLEPNSGILTVRGVEDNPLTQGMYLVMAGSGGAWNQNSTDVVAVLPGAEALFLYRTEEPDELAGVRVNLFPGELFFCCFGIEGINDSTSSGNTKAEVLDAIFSEFNITGVETGISAPLPAELTLHPPYPDPFNAQLVIPFDLPVAAPVHLVIYDILGKTVYETQRETVAAGSNHWIWKASSGLSSGIYFVQLRTESKSMVHKVVYLK